MKDTKKFYNENKEKVVIAKSDKSNHTVEPDRSEYLEKIKVLLSDNSSYNILKRNRTLSLQMNINDLIKSVLVFDLGREDKLELNGCIVHNAIAPKFYELIKTHKYNSLRPIVTTLLYKISNI